MATAVTEAAVTEAAVRAVGVRELRQVPCCGYREGAVTETARSILAGILTYGK
jgi:hypothetical protein